MAEALQGAGHIVAIYPLGTFLTAPNPDFEIYVFHRPSTADTRLRTVLTALRQLRRITIADIDRHIFEEDDSGKPGRDEDEVLGLQLFEKVTVPSHALADAVRNNRSGADIHVAPDSLPKSLLGLHEARESHLQARPTKSLVYVHPPEASGQPFRDIWDVLYTVINEQRGVTLTNFGEMDAPDTLRRHPGVTIEPPLLRPYRITTYSRFDCVLAPTLPGPLSRCDSRADYMEATLAGSSFISSPLPDLPPLRQPNLKIAPSPAEWYEHLTDLIENPVEPEDMLSCVNRTIEVRSTKRFVADYLKFATGS